MPMRGHPPESGCSLRRPLSAWKSEAARSTAGPSGLATRTTTIPQSDGNTLLIQYESQPEDHVHGKEPRGELPNPMGGSHRRPESIATGRTTTSVIAKAVAIASVRAPPSALTPVTLASGDLIHPLLPQIVKRPVVPR